MDDWDDTELLLSWLPSLPSPPMTLEVGWESELLSLPLSQPSDTSSSLPVASLLHSGQDRGVSDLSFFSAPAPPTIASQTSTPLPLPQPIRMDHTYASSRSPAKRKRNKHRHLHTDDVSNTRIFAYRKRCIMNPLASRFHLPIEWENMGLPLAISHGAYRALNRGVKAASILRFGRWRLVSVPTLQLMQMAGFENRLGPFSLEEVEQFYTALPSVYPETGDWQLCLYTSAAPPVCRWGSLDAANSIDIFISRSDGEPIKDIHEDMEPEFHSAIIQSLPAFMGYDRFCRRCFRGANGNKNRPIRHCPHTL